jgi:hypothetical protein
VPIEFSFQSPEGEKLRVGFTRLAEFVGDLRPFYAEAIRELELWTDEEIFPSEGASGRGAWKPRHPVSKIIRRHQGLEPDGPLLIATGRLREALTNSATGFSLRAISATGFVWGTKGLPYAAHQQFGTKQRGVTRKQQFFLGRTFGVWMKLGKKITMPARPPVDLGKGGKLHPGLMARGPTGMDQRGLTPAARRFLLNAMERAEMPPAWDNIIARDFDLAIDHKD